MIRSISNNGNPILLFDKVTLTPGINLLGGGNGVGKTTLLKEVKRWAQENDHFFEDTFEDRLRRNFGTVGPKSSITVDVDGALGRCMFYSNTKHNHRNKKLDGNATETYAGDFLDVYQSGERSEGENVVVSFIAWLDNAKLTKDDVLFIDEIDSGLSVDALNGIAFVLTSVLKKTQCQIVVTCNTFHFPYVFGPMVNLRTGDVVDFGKSYEKFCDFSFANALLLGKVRDAAQEKQRKDMDKARDRRLKRRSALKA